ncbi:hypothetical protein CLIB1423_43S00122 [[Candida] railenensis]|uniref:Uncharacterized protein n=1 Tax=[Candida] railenensis TaxID=45579 RepID=A0A9P0QWN0_9ASCO|nr:hypothetical protein CLIB1423_43S00122 [[Candida] railenensis]
MKLLDIKRVILHKVRSRKKYSRSVNLSQKAILRNSSDLCRSCRDFHALHFNPPSKLCNCASIDHISYTNPRMFTKILHLKSAGNILHRLFQRPENTQQAMNRFRKKVNNFHLEK